MTLAEAIDAQLAAPALVIGSPPPGGRDLDLLMRPAEAEELGSWLAREGFLERGGQWVRFRDCSVESVDLVVLTAWGLSEESARNLFLEARPLPGYNRLMRPASSHLLLALGRRLVESDGRLRPKHRARIELALAEDVDAFEVARAAAPTWRADRALAALELAYRSGARISRSARAAALAEWPYAEGRTPTRARVRAWLEAGRTREPRGQLVAFSGLDGAGKSSQAEALSETLGRLGWETTVQWVRLEWTTLWENRWLGFLGWPARTSLGLLARVRMGSGKDGPAPLTPTAVRQRSGVVANVWVTVVALAHALAQRRETRRHLRRGVIVISDRYTLDAAAHLRFRYGESRPFQFQIRLVEFLSPRPLRSYFVDVPSETAYARKAEQYSLDELTRQARIYRELAASLGVRRLDGERPREELCAGIGEDLWRALL